MTILETVLQSALSLDVADRAALAERLLASLDELSAEEAERLWAEESRRRLNAYRAGRASSASGSLVRPVWTGPGCTIVLAGATSQWKRSDAGSCAIGPPVGSPAAIRSIVPSSVATAVGSQSGASARSRLSSSCALNSCRIFPPTTTRNNVKRSTATLAMTFVFFE